MCGSSLSGASPGRGRPDPGLPSSTLKSQGEFWGPVLLWGLMNWGARGGSEHPPGQSFLPGLPPSTESGLSRTRPWGPSSDQQEPTAPDVRVGGHTRRPEGILMARHLVIVGKLLYQGPRGEWTWGQKEWVKPSSTA